MAKVTNAFATYSAAANREALSNAIYNIDPYDTPIMTMSSRRDTSNRTFDWQTEALPAVNLTNADEEGYLLANAASTPTVRLTNNTQISHRDATVSGSQEASDAAGKRSEMARQMAISSKALKRDIESIAGQNQARVVGNDAGTARKTRAIEHWINTNISGGAGYTAPVSDTAALTDGTSRAISETLFNDTLQLCYDSGAQPGTALVRAAIKRKISAFAGRSGTQVPTNEQELVNSVDLYKSDFGNIKIVPTRWTRQRATNVSAVLFLDPDYVAFAFFRNFHTWDAAKVGDADTKVIQAEWGIEMRNEKAHGKLADVS
jgi:hypothetical protein